MPRRDLFSAAHVFPACPGEGQQGDLTGLFDSTGQHALMSGAGASLAAWADLAFISDQAFEHINFFIVNGDGLVSAKLTGLRAGEKATFAASTFSA